MSLWQRVDALRELLHEGGLLLGEVVTLTRNAEESLAAASAERSSIEQNRVRTEEECRQLRLEAANQSSEVFRLRAEVTALRQEAAKVRTVSTDSSQTVDSRGQEALKTRLLHVETMLEQTRATLSSERERRNRAISLIKPVTPVAQPSPVS